MATIYYKNTNGRLYYMETTKYITQLDILHMDKGKVEISIKPLDWEHRDLATEIIKKSEFLEVYLKASESINADSGITIIPIEMIDYNWHDDLDPNYRKKKWKKISTKIIKKFFG